MAATYAQYVNNHILLLGIAAACSPSLARLAEEARPAQVSWTRLLGLGLLAGLGYTIDLGVGPVLLACAFAVVAFRCRRFRCLAVFLLAALPWLVLHHAVNYAVGGTFKPANAVPDYFQWPGSSFNVSNLTGGWNHHSLRRFLFLRGGSAVRQARLCRP